MPPRNTHRPAGPVIVSICMLLCWRLPAAQAQEEDLDQGRVYAVQPRAYKMNHEFALTFGFLPLDAFYKMFSVNGHYVVHFDDLFAWEAVHLSFSKYLDVSTGLKEELADRWDTSPTSPEEDRIDFTLDTNLMFKPLYGKMALFDSLVIHSETYFLLGVGAEKFETAWFPAIDFGVGIRIFIIETISARLEVREYIHFGEGVGSTLAFVLGFSYNAFAEEARPGHSLRKELAK
ncbi:MAG: outer membrane beta-barrel domain-containing protein [Deltaproteobacteria bacterium]|nr:outer membrane beta-barrel domain-containing protein [Deltaproteobacteria bacterium]